MILKRVGGLGVAIGLALGLGACTDGYGYSGLSVGYGSGYGDYYGDDPYGYGGYDGYGPSSFGWYGDYYYPGTGVYVYDRYRRAYRWNGAQQRYWQGQQRYRGRDWNGQGAWNGFYRDDRNRAGQAGTNGRPADRTWQDSPGTRPWRGNRNGYTPGGRGDRGRPGAQPYRDAPRVQGDRPSRAEAPGGTPAPRMTPPQDGGWSRREPDRSSAQSTPDTTVRPE